MTTAPTRILAIVLLTSTAGGCFALFSLDSYGDASTVVSGDAGQGTDAQDTASATADGGSSSTLDAGGAHPGKIVFVTSADFGVGIPFPDGFGSVKGAHDLCKVAAERAHLTGTFLAWVFDDRGTNQWDAPSNPAGDQTLVTPDHRLIAANLAELRDGGPRVAIAVTENGTTLPDAPPADATGQGGAGCPASGLVWTGTKGGPSDAIVATQCANWTAGSALTGGGVGRIAKHPTEWTFACNLPCNQRARLYCFQQ